MTGALYLVSTPIGNLADLSFRAVETLKKVDLIACEDTRHSKILLDHYGITKPLVSFFDATERRKSLLLIEKMNAGQSIALISDAGTPGIADPGYRLVRAALEAGIALEAVPGPAAFLTALSLSGLPTDSFIFDGFLPVKSGARRKQLGSYKTEERTVILYESPHRILKTLADIQTELGDVRIVVARELTKKFQEVTRGKVSEAVTRYSEAKIRGEFVILFNLSENGG